MTLATALASVCGSARAAGDGSALVTIDVLDSTLVPATGRGEVDVRLLIHAPDGEPLCGSRVRVTIERGDAALANRQPFIDAACTASGLVVVPVFPGTIAGPLELSVSVAPNRSAAAVLHLVAAPQPPIVVGVATVGVGAVPGPIEAPDGAPNGANARRAGVGLYAAGTIARGTTGTFAYDSADTLQAQTSTGPFLDDPADRPFPIYGDGSVRYDDALSRYRMYARIQNGRSSAVLGEFQAVATPDDVAGGYSILLNGVQAHAEGNAASATAFTARNDVAYNRQIISPTGLAVASQALAPDIVVGSDVLMLVHLDRRTGAILSQAPLIRGVDYDIDYASGLLRFLTIVLPFDDAFNPQIVVVQYEYGGSGAHSTLLGASAAVKLRADGRSRLDSWYLNDSIGTGNLTVTGAAVTGKLAGGGWSLSHERSNGALPVSQTQFGSGGDNYLGTLALANGRFSADLRASTTSAGYTNPFGAYATPGLTSVNLRLTERVSRIAGLELTYLMAANDLPAGPSTTAVTNRDASAELRLRVQPSARFSYHAGIKSDTASGNGTIDPISLAGANAGIVGGPNSIFAAPAFAATAATATAGVGSSIDAEYGAKWQFTRHASIAAERSDPLGATSDPYDPRQTQAELTLDLGSRATAFVRQLWQSAAVQPLAATQGEQTYAATATSTTSAGIAQQVGNATLEYGYAVEHTANATDLYNAIGLNQTFDAGKRLSGDAFVQIGRSLLPTFGTQTGSGTPSFVVLGTALSYALKNFHAGANVQVRDGYLSGSTFELGAAGTLSAALSAFGSFRGDYANAVTDDELRLGLSYRPENSDRYVTLATVDSQNSTLTNYDGYVTNVAQLQELYRPNRRTEFAASLAYKLTGDAFFLPRTTIFGIRADQRVGARFDLATEFHQSSTAPIAGVRATGFVMEGGMRLGDAMRLAAGYNFSGFADPSTAVNPMHRGVYVTMSSYIDRIFGWGKEARQP